MGFNLVRDVVGLLATVKISDRARTVALVMAYHSMDATGIYKQGHGLLALALAFSDHESPAARQAIRRAVRELLEAGVIEIERDATRGQNREYHWTHVREESPSGAATGLPEPGQPSRPGGPRRSRFPL